MCVCVIQSQMYLQSRRFFHSVELSPYSAHIYLNRGNLYASLGQFENAEQDYSHGMSMNVNDCSI